MRRSATLRGILLVVAAGCAVVLAQIVERPVGSTPLSLQVTPVALNPESPRQTAVGRFVYAGGVELRADTARFGGLSDLEVLDDGRLVSVTDEGDLLRARLVLDDRGRLSGLADADLTPLAGRDGPSLVDKSFADAEGLTFLPNGDRLVSFERQHRIWRYPAGGGPPVDAPAPAEARSFPFNGGLEALVALPARGEDAYLTGSEGGTVWLCHVGSACRETQLGRRVPEGFGLTGFAVTRDGGILALLARSFDAATGVRVRLRLMRPDALDEPDTPLLDELAFVDPLTRDNFEGVAIAQRAGGAIRIYLLSDNNYSDIQHTYLLAFDWSPAS